MLWTETRTYVKTELAIIVGRADCLRAVMIGFLNAVLAQGLRLARRVRLTRREEMAVPVPSNGGASSLGQVWLALQATAPGS